MLGQMQVAEYTKQIYLVPSQTSILINRITTILGVSERDINNTGPVGDQGYSKLSVQGQYKLTMHINWPKVAVGTTELPLRSGFFSYLFFHSGME